MDAINSDQRRKSALNITLEKSKKSYMKNHNLQIKIWNSSFYELKPFCCTEVCISIHEDTTLLR